MFSLVSRFSSSILQWVGRFFTKLPTLIPIPIRLIEPTSKREGNYNIMITGPADHGLHVIQSREFNYHPAYMWLANFILKSYMLRPHLLCHRYELFFILAHCRYNLISLVPTRPLINTSSFWSRSSTRHIWVNQAIRFDLWLTRKDYLQISAFPNLVVVEREEHLHAIRKATRGGAMSKVVRETAG